LLGPQGNVIAINLPADQVNRYLKTKLTN
jgi:hypothetical protein